MKRLVTGLLIVGAILAINYSGTSPSVATVNDLTSTSVAWQHRTQRIGSEYRPYPRAERLAMQRWTDNNRPYIAYLQAFTPSACQADAGYQRHLGAVMGFSASLARGDLVEGLRRYAVAGFFIDRITRRCAP